MKWIIPALFILACIVATIIGIGILRKNERETKSELQQAIKERDESIRREDSIRRHLNSLQDSLEIAFLLLENSKKDVESAKAETKKVKQRYAKIPYVKHPDDSSRLRELTRLFPAIH